MKKTIFILLILISLLSSVALVQGDPTYNIQVTFSTNPIIVAPGTYDYIEVNFKNIGSETIHIWDINAKSLDSSVIQPKGNWNVELGDLDGGDSTTVLYEFFVSSTATAGFYQVVFDISCSGHDSRQTAMIKVEDSTILDITSVKPSSIKIGEITTLVFNITNNGGASASNILFTWEDSSDLILPVGSDNRITIPAIAAKNYTEIPIDIVASPSITPGVYPLTITLEFYDRTGTKQTITSEVGLQIGGTTDFEIVLQQSSSGTTSFAIANTGVNVASSVIVSIPQQTNYVASGASSVSLGNLDAGDYTLASFQLSSVDVDRNNTGRPSFNGPPGDMGEMPSDFNFGDRNSFMNRSFGGFGSNNLIVEIAYTDLFGIRQVVEKEVVVSSIVSSGVSSGASSFASRFGDRSGFSGQTEESSDGTMYIIIGAVGIILVFAILKLGKRKTFLKLIKKKGKNK